VVNSDPYGEGWILKLELTGELPPDLMDEAEYKKSAEASAH
jgi:glycine cleavage system H lipoate-binding protein